MVTTSPAPSPSPSPSPRRLAVSYRRFSDPQQAKGDSEARQERDFRSFCQRHNLTPLVETFIDRARSGYHDVHRKKGRLGDLIAAAKDGRFEPGTVIVVEAWDRLGRLRPDKQVDLVSELVKTGVSIGICRVDDIFMEEDFGTYKWTMLSTFAQLAYQESKQKSERLAASWQKRRALAREVHRIMTRQIPAWLRAVNGQLVPIPERVAAIKRIFELVVIAGYGRARIIAQLLKEKVPAFGPSGKWTTPYLNRILNDRRVLGEFQPRKANAVPDGGVIKGYYPRLIDDEQFELARVAQSGRRGFGGGRKPTRLRKYVNVFQSLLVCANDGEGMCLRNHGTAARLDLILSNTAGPDGRAKQTFTFPYLLFEEAVLAMLQEVDPKQVLAKDKVTVRQEDVLRAKLLNIRADMAQLKASLRLKYSKSIDAVLRDTEKAEEAIASQLQEELAKSARPTEKAWDKLPSLVGLIRSEGDEARLRLRPILGSVVEEAWLLFCRRGSYQLCEAQFYFVAGAGARRDYFLIYQARAFRRPRRFRAYSLRVEGPTDAAVRDPMLSLELFDVGDIRDPLLRAYRLCYLEHMTIERIEDLLAPAIGEEDDIAEV
jgi:DNA invertase Pin-like site-specific DNA recombinase